MSKKVMTKEWTLDMPWGKLAMISWGDSSKPPILLVHGYVDSAGTFIPLMEELPDDYYYVAFDIPGHGKSDPFPPNLAISQLYVVDVIRRVVDSLQWKEFIYLGHSMATVIGLFYNYVYPHRISTMILIDPAPAFAFYEFVHYKPSGWYHYVYDEFYSNYDRYNSKKRLYSYEDAVTMTAGNRNLTVEQAEVILSRALELEGDKYRFSMDPRMKLISNVPASKETIETAITSNKLPTLILEASNKSMQPGIDFAIDMLEKSTAASNYFKITVAGHHDLHITNPRVAAKHIKIFLNDTKNKTKRLSCKI